MKINKFKLQLIFSIILSTGISPIQCENWAQAMVRGTFKLGAGTIGAVGSLLVAGLGILDPFFNTVDLITEEAFNAVNPFANRIRASHRVFFQEEQLNNGFGDAWNLLVDHGNQLKEEGKLHDPLEDGIDGIEGNGGSKGNTSDSEQTQRIEIAMVINDKIAQLNQKFGSNHNAYPKGIFDRVQKLMDVLYTPGFNVNNPEFKSKVRDLISEIEEIYSRPVLDEAKLASMNTDGKRSYLDKFDLLVDKLETSETTDNNVASEYIQNFINKHYKSSNGEFYWKIEGIVYSIQLYLSSPEFDFFKDESIIQIVAWIKEIEEIYFNLPENKDNNLRRRSHPIIPEELQQENSNLLIISPEAELTINNLPSISDPLGLIKLYLKSYYQAPGTSTYYECLKPNIIIIKQLIQENTGNLDSVEVQNKLRLEFNKLEAEYWKNIQASTILSGPKLGPGYNIYNTPGKFPVLTALQFADIKQETKGFLTFLHMGNYPQGKTFSNLIYDYLQTHYTNSTGEFDTVLQPLVDKIKLWADNPNSNPLIEKNIESLIKLFVKLEFSFFKKGENAAGETFKMEQKHAQSKRNIFGVTVDFVQGLIDCVI